MEQDPTFPTDGPTDGHDSMLYEAPLAPNTCCKRTKWECPGEIPKDCANTRCEKKIHDICYRHFVYNKLEERTELVSPHTKEHLVVCSRTCYNKVLRNFSTMATKRIPWNKDAPDNNPSQTSEKILIEWLTTEGNYNKYRGWRNHGTTKHTFAKEISALMVSAGVKSNRTPQSIMDKIAQLEKQFTVASDWLNKTGQGLQGIESEKSIEESVKKRCPHYYDLLMTFGDRAKVRPTVTSEDLLSSEGEEEEDGDSPDIMVGTDIYTPAAKPLKKSASSSTAGEKNKKRKRRMSDDDSFNSTLRARFAKDDEMMALKKAESEATRREKEAQVRESEARTREINERSKRSKMKELLEIYERFKKLGFSDEKCLRLEPELEILIAEQSND